MSITSRLLKLADTLDAQGRFSRANYVDSITKKIAALQEDSMAGKIFTCGCSPTASKIIKDESGEETRVPWCIVHDTGELIDAPNLDAREAKCPYCKKNKPSSIKLPFFEYRGPGSPSATDMCKNCGYHRNAHKADNFKCKQFTPSGGLQYDSYYCGCRGWD